MIVLCISHLSLSLQKQAMLVRQLEEELRLRMRQPAPELQQQLEALFAENEHLQREIAILRDTIKVGNEDNQNYIVSVSDFDTGLTNFTQIQVSLAE